jgi:hypothetical protein
MQQAIKAQNALRQPKDVRQVKHKEVRQANKSICNEVLDASLTQPKHESRNHKANLSSSTCSTARRILMVPKTKSTKLDFRGLTSFYCDMSREKENLVANAGRKDHLNATQI